MRGADTFTENLFAMRKLVPAAHPLRAIRTRANAALPKMNGLFATMYEADVKGVQPSVVPEKLLRAMPVFNVVIKMFLFYFTILIGLQLPDPAFASAVDEIKLIYSADDGICKITTTAFNEINFRHPGINYISEVRSEFMQISGFGQPQWIDRLEPEIAAAYSDPGHELNDEDVKSSVDNFLRDNGGYWWGGAFFRADVIGDGVQRLVYMKHEAAGSHGLYTTTVWLLKPGASYKTADSVEPETGRVIENLDPEIVDLQINLSPSSLGPWKYSSPTVLNNGIRFKNEIKPTPIVVKLISILRGPPQEVFTKGRDVYFLAGSPLLDSGFIYRITSKMNVEPLCVYARPQLISYLKN